MLYFQTSKYLASEPAIEFLQCFRENLPYINIQQFPAQSIPLQDNSVKVGMSKKQYRKLAFCKNVISLRMNVTILKLHTPFMNKEILFTFLQLESDI